MALRIEKHNHPCWGLTGGIGSGKSTVAQIWQKHQNVHLIDADAISRQLTQAHGQALPEIAAQFGTHFIDAQTGGLDRAKMREYIFTHPSARLQLEAIIHPLVHAQINAQIQQSIALGCCAALIDIPLLAQSSEWPKILDKIIVVDCDEQTQIERVKARSQLGEAQILRIIAAQSSRQERLAMADIVIHNQGISLHELEQQIIQVIKGIEAEEPIRK